MIHVAIKLKYTVGKKKNHISF